MNRSMLGEGGHLAEGYKGVSGMDLGTAVLFTNGNLILTFPTGIALKFSFIGMRGQMTHQSILVRKFF